MEGASFNRTPAGRTSVSRFFSAIVKCSASRPIVHPRRPLAPRPQPITQRRQHCLARDHHLRALHLVVGLRVITDIGKEDAPGLFHQQQSSAPGKTAEISDVGQMADQQAHRTGWWRDAPAISSGAPGSSLLESLAGAVLSTQYSVYSAHPYSVLRNGTRSVARFCGLRGAEY